MFLKKSTMQSTEINLEKINNIQELLQNSENILIGAGAGLSASAELLYEGDRFKRLFPNFIEKYHLEDMYSAGFYPYKTLEEFWAYWSKHIYYNRYDKIDSTVYTDLLKLVQDKNYFAITTNVDHLFQKNGFDKARLFYTQGDYGLFQCSAPCHATNYDNEKAILKMVQEQKDLKIPSHLIPYCPKCGRPMTINIRKDNTFVQDEGWYTALSRYEGFIKKYQDTEITLLELGVGYNTPSIIKFPFYELTRLNKKAHCIGINFDSSCLPPQENRFLGISADIGAVLKSISKSKHQTKV